MAIAAAPVAKVTLLPLGFLAAAAWFGWGRRAQPVASASSSHHRRRWMVAGALSIGARRGDPAIDGGELNQVSWTVFAVALLAGIGMAVTAMVLGASSRAHRLAA